jgi:2-alkyl-3-oxoalkanoate reductase
MTELVAERIAEPIVVTGATGFIGRRLVRRLLDDGYRVRTLVLPHDKLPIEWGDAAVDVRRSDITMRHTVREALAGAATVFHLAAVVGDWGKKELFERVTVGGTRNVLEESARIQARAILVSSIVVYGKQLQQRICDEDSDFGQPLGAYSWSKQQQEVVARKIEAETGLRLTVVRPANVYGPGSPPWVDMLVDALKEQQPTLVGEGSGCAGLTYVDNVVDILVRVAERPGSVGRVYNANDDHGVTWNRYVYDLAELCGTKPPKAVPRLLARLGAHLMEGSYRILRRDTRPPITHEALNLTCANLRIPIERACHDLGYRAAVDYPVAMAAVADYLSTRLD